MTATRTALLKAFNKLDSQPRPLLQLEEMNYKALKKLGIYLALPGLHLKVVIDELDGDLFTSRTTAPATSSSARREFKLLSWISF